MSDSGGADSGGAGRGRPPEPELRASGSRISESFPVRSGGTLFVDLDRGSLEVRSHPRNEVRVETDVSGIGGDLVHFSVETEGIDVWIDGMVGGWLHWLALGARIRVRCWVPDECAVDARTRGGSVRMRDIGAPVAIETSGGRIQVDGVDGPVTAKTSGAGIEVAEVDGNLEARTSGGRITAANVEGDVDVRTSGGRVEVYGARGRIEARSSGGRIFASFSTEEPSGELRTSGGPIEVLLPADADCTLDARTSGGGVKVDREFDLHGLEPRKKHRVYADLNAGGDPLVLRTSGGPIRVRAR